MTVISASSQFTTNLKNTHTEIEGRLSELPGKSWKVLELPSKPKTLRQILEYVRNNQDHMLGSVAISFQNITVIVNYCHLEHVDLKSCAMAQSQIFERLACDVSMSYLSTLGGAFSSLGDEFLNCAERAGEISKEQFKIALRLKEEPMAARCCIFLALSFIQRRNFKDARKIILEQYETSKKINDERLMNMCRGVWAKLQYAKKISTREG